MAALGQLVPLAHGGVAGAVVETAFALLIVAIALAVWVGSRGDDAPGASDSDDDPPPERGFAPREAHNEEDVRPRAPRGGSAKV
jgi:hypothetical protein